MRVFCITKPSSNDYADDVVQLADYLKLKKFAIVGVTGGGPYAAVAYKIPRRLTNVGIVVGLGPTWMPELLHGMSFIARISWDNYAKYPWLRFLATLYYYIVANYLPFLLVLSMRARVDKKAAFKLFKANNKKLMVNSLMNSKEIF